MIKVHVMWRGMWRKTYDADAWTFFCHLLALAAVALVVYIIERA